MGYKVVIDEDNWANYSFKRKLINNGKPITSV